jgi:hypothetical protein
MLDSVVSLEMESGSIATLLESQAGAEASHVHTKLKLRGITIEDMLLLSNLVDEEAKQSDVYIDTGYAILDGPRYELTWILYLFQQQTA